MRMPFKSIFIEESLRKTDLALELMAKYPEKIVLELPQLETYRQGKQHLSVIAKKGETFSICASLSEEYICCGAHVLRTVSNCPFNCTYCFLQNYLTNTHTYVLGDLAEVVADVQAKIALQPERLWRIGTWELGDSLALEPLVHQASNLILAFSNQSRALLELKTKSSQVEEILNLPHNGRTVISWSLNPAQIIKAEEAGTACLEERLAAMQQVVEHGYLTAFHFDPMIYHPGWQESYQKLVMQIAKKIKPEQVAWISIGSLRFNPEMKQIIETNFPLTKLTSSEMLLGGDRKMRYIKPIRLDMYRYLYHLLLRNGFGEVFTYLCMERWDMWEKVFGFYPASNEEHSDLLTKSLYQRFPKLNV